MTRESWLRAVWHRILKSKPSGRFGEGMGAAASLPYFSCLSRHAKNQPSEIDVIIM
jgi:hypothetical protein